MADPRTRHRGHDTAAQPRPECQLKVLASPDLLVGVEAADVQEVRPVHGDGAANQRGRPERPAFSQRGSLHVIRHLDPNVPETQQLILNGGMSAIEYNGGNQQKDTVQSDDLNDKTFTARGVLSAEEPL